MARVTPHGLVGSIGNIVYYVVDGQTYARSRPGSQPKGRKRNDRSSKVFGIVSGYGTPMVRNVKPYFLFPFKLQTYNAMRSWMREQYLAHEHLDEWPVGAVGGRYCQLNPVSDLRTFTGIVPMVSITGGSVLLQWPAFEPKRDVKAPWGTDEILLKAVAVRSSFNERREYSDALDTLSVPYTDAAFAGATQTLDLKAKAGDVVLVLIALEFEGSYDRKSGMCMNPKYLPGMGLAMGRV